MVDRAPPGGWEHLESRRQNHGQKVAVGDPDFDRMCASVLSTGAGAELLKMLRKRTVDAPDDPYGSDCALRVKAARSQFVRELEAAAERGRKASEPKGSS